MPERMRHETKQHNVETSPTKFEKEISQMKWPNLRTQENGGANLIVRGDAFHPPDDFTLRIAFFN